MPNADEQPDLQNSDQDSEKPSEGGENTASQEEPASFLRNLRESKLKVGIYSSVFLLLSGSIYWYVTRDTGPLPQDELAKALALLEIRGNTESRQESRVIAQSLIDLDYRDPQFAGAPEFIMGIAAFRDARTKYGMERDRLYSLAAEYLLEAESRTLDTAYRPEWAYALGSSLYGTGQVTKSRKLLEEAVETFEIGRAEASFRLIDLYFDIKTPELLEKALELNSKLHTGDGLTPVQMEEVYLRRAQILLALNRKQEAHETYEEYDRRSGKKSGNLGILVLRAQTLMDSSRYEKALELLRPVAEEKRLEVTFPRQASYLQGVCAMKLKITDAAIFYFERTASKYEDSHEGLAANVYLASLLHGEGRSEEAFLAYQRALHLVRRPEDYRNQWLNLEEFQTLILDAWNKWKDAGDFENAIALSDIMYPLFPRIQSLELNANAHQSWAERLEQEILELPVGEREKHQEELRDRWRKSGRAYAKLANGLFTSSQYSDALWISAEHYQKGHDFYNSLNQLTRFLNTRPKFRRPLALLRRGKLLMDLGRLDEALEHFKGVVRNFPRDASAFDARLWIGRCYLEKDAVELSEKAFREILDLEFLTPKAEEWRQAQFELGRLLFHSASAIKANAENPNNSDEPLVRRQEVLKAYAQWEEAISLLDEFLKREDPVLGNSILPVLVMDDRGLRTAEARFLLSRSLQMSAELPRNKLKLAETENARSEHHRTMEELLKQAKQEYQILRDRLLTMKDGEQLDELGSRFLRDSYFQIAHTYYDLENYEEAVIAFSSAVHRYSDDPQVLLAYIQMANCHVRLNNPVEARSQIEQARVILNRLSEDVFETDQTNMSKEEWKLWLDRWSLLHPDIVNQRPITTQ